MFRWLQSQLGRDGGNQDSAGGVKDEPSSSIKKPSSSIKSNISPIKTSSSSPIKTTHPNSSPLAVPNKKKGPVEIAMEATQGSVSKLEASRMLERPDTLPNKILDTLPNKILEKMDTITKSEVKPSVELTDESFLSAVTEFSGTEEDLHEEEIWSEACWDGIDIKPTETMDIEEQGSFQDCIDIQPHWNKIFSNNETDAKYCDSPKSKNVVIDNESVPLFAVTNLSEEFVKQTDKCDLESYIEKSKSSKDESNLSDHNSSPELTLKNEANRDRLSSADHQSIDQSVDLITNQCDISLDTDTGYSECSLLESTQSGEAASCEDNLDRYEIENCKDSHGDLSHKIQQDYTKNICSVDGITGLLDKVDLNNEISNLENVAPLDSSKTDIANKNLELNIPTFEKLNFVDNNISDTLIESNVEKLNETNDKIICLNKADKTEISSCTDNSYDNGQKMTNNEGSEIESKKPVDKSSSSNINTTKKNTKENISKNAKSNRTKRKGSKKSLSETSKEKSDGIHKVDVNDLEHSSKIENENLEDKTKIEDQDEVFNNEDMDLCNSMEVLSQEKKGVKEHLENSCNGKDDMDLCKSLEYDEKNVASEKSSTRVEYKQTNITNTCQDETPLESKFCFYRHHGKLGTIEEQRCIITSLNDKETTLQIGSESICKLVVWRGKKALQLSEVPDNKEILFTAIKHNDNWNIIVMWLQNFIPSICEEPQNQEEYLFLDGRALNVEILAFDGNCGQARTKFDRDVVTVDFYLDQVFIDERRAPAKLMIMKLMWNSSTHIFGQIWKALRSDGSITFVCTCLWTGNGVAGMQYRKSLSHPQQRKIYRIQENGCFFPADAQVSVYCDINGVLKFELNNGVCQSYQVKCSADGEEMLLPVDNGQLYEGLEEVCIESLLRKLESQQMCNDNNTTLEINQGVKVHLQRCIIDHIQSWKVLMLQIDDTVSEENIRQATLDYKQAVVKDKPNKDDQSSSIANQIKVENRKINKPGTCPTETLSNVEKSSKGIPNKDFKTQNFSSVLRDWSGVLQILDGSHFVIATKVNSELIYIPLTKPPVYHRGEVKVNLKPGTSIKFDAVYNMRTRKYHVITLWEGTQPDYACIGPQVTFYFNVQGTYNGSLDKIVKLTVILGDAAVEIEALKTERVFTSTHERLTARIPDGASLLLHLKKDSSSSDNKPLWSIPLMIMNEASGEKSESNMKGHLECTPEVNGTVSVEDDQVENECTVKVKPKEGTLVKDLTCKVVRAEEGFALLSALGNVIILQKQDFYSHGKIMCDLYTFHEEIYKFQNVGATVYEMADSIIVCGESVSHVAMLAWGGKKPFNAYDIMRGWWKTPTKKLNFKEDANLSGKRKRIPSMTYYSKNKFDLSNSMKTFQNQTLLLERRDATGYIYKVMKTSGLIEVHSKFLQGGKAMADFKPSALYINGAPLTCDDQLSWPFNMELYQGQCWHCLLESCPVENIDGMQVVFKAKLVWRGRKPTVQEIKEWNLYQLEQVQLQMDQCDEYHKSEGGWSFQELRQLQERLRQNQYLYLNPSQRKPVTKSKNYRRKSQNDTSPPAHSNKNSHAVLRNTSSLPPGYSVPSDNIDHATLEEDVMDNGFTPVHDS